MYQLLDVEFMSNILSTLIQKKNLEMLRKCLQPSILATFRPQNLALEQVLQKAAIYMKHTNLLIPGLKKNLITERRRGSQRCMEDSGSDPTIGSRNLMMIVLKEPWGECCIY